MIELEVAPVPEACHAEWRCCILCCILLQMSQAGYLHIRMSNGFDRFVINLPQTIRHRRFCLNYGTKVVKLTSVIFSLVAPIASVSAAVVSMYLFVPRTELLLMSVCLAVFFAVVPFTMSARDRRYPCVAGQHGDGAETVPQQ